MGLAPRGNTAPDGGDLALGATTDAAVTGDASGTLIGHIRYLAKFVASIWATAYATVRTCLMVTNASPVTGQLVTVNSNTGDAQSASPLLFQNAGTDNIRFLVRQEVQTGATFDARRIAKLVGTVAATASGDTAVVTPTSGKKWRLLGACLSVTGNAVKSSGGTLTITLRDATTDLKVTWSVYVPSSALNTTEDFVSPWMTLGNGLLSAVADNVLNVNLDAALSGGVARVVVAYGEE